MASRSIREIVEHAFTHGHGQTETKLKAIRNELEETVGNEEESDAQKTAASEDLQYVEGVLETPGPFLTDLAYIKRKRRT